MSQFVTANEGDQDRPWLILSLYSTEMERPEMSSLFLKGILDENAMDHSIIPPVRIQSPALIWLALHESH